MRRGAAVIDPIRDALAAAKPRLSRVNRRLRREYHHHGLFEAGLLSARLVRDAAAAPIQRPREQRLFRMLGVEVSSEPAGLDGVSLNEAMHAASLFHDGRHYDHTPPRAFQQTLEALDLDELSHYTFIDLGCGKGLTLVLAAYHGFGTVLGVELDPGLAGTSRQNIGNYLRRHPGGTARIEVAVQDAALYQFPETPIVVFLFNPFGPETLDAVVKNLETSVACAPRAVDIIYFNPVHARVLDSSSAFRRRSSAGRPHSPRWIVYRAVTPQ